MCVFRYKYMFSFLLSGYYFLHLGLGGSLVLLSLSLSEPWLLLLSPAPHFLRFLSAQRRKSHPLPRLHSQLVGSSPCRRNQEDWESVFLSRRLRWPRFNPGFLDHEEASSAKLRKPPLTVCSRLSLVRFGSLLISFCAWFLLIEFVSCLC